MSGRFITLDGTEGSGKSTQIERTAAYLRERGHTVYTTREPGGTAVGEAIRAIFLDSSLAPTAAAELLLIFAARRQHLETEIWPRLARGEYVVSDRFNDATYAYQGCGRGLPDAQIRTLEQWTQGDFQPDLSLILTLPANIAETRLTSRGRQKDRMEQENHDFFARIAQGYANRAAALPHVHAIDASGTPETVFAHIRAHLDRLPDS